MKKSSANILEQAFSEALSALNKEQRRAVDTIEGPVMVIAGPGTGKTQILTLRIANILIKTDLQPENILALTFTDSGVKAMRERLRKYIGATAYRVPIYTFHGFAQHLINHYPDAFPKVIGGRAITDVEKVEILDGILKEPSLKLLRPLGNQTYYVPHLLAIISHMKQEYVSADNLSFIIAKQEEELVGIEKIHQKGAHKGKVRGEYSKMEKVIEKNKELQYVYRYYEATLASAHLYDFDDMIAEAVRALVDDENLLRELQETYQYILADEHQDVNGAQNKILEQLCNFHPSPNIFVVGDEKQAIYRFQGASLSNFLYFTDVFPTTKTIALTSNYRSGQLILDVAQELITCDDESLMKLRVPLKAELVKDAKIEERKFSHQVVEDDWLTMAVVEQVNKGVPPQEIAVIVRSNKEVESITALLRKAGLSVVASADGDILDHPITKVVESLLNAVLTDTDESSLLAVIHGAYWGIETADIIKLASTRSYQESLSSLIVNKDRLVAIGISEVEKILRIGEVLATARLREVHEPPHRVLEYLLTASGLIEHLLTHDPYEGVRVVRRLYDELEAMVVRDGVATLKGVSTILATRRLYGLPLSAPYLATATEAVQVMTAHKSKGLEFSVVFVPHVQDNNWGGKNRATMFKLPLTSFVSKDEEIDPIDDEKRLLYVAMTRAKKELYISNSKQSIAGKELMDSRLMTEAVTAKLVQADVRKFETSFSPVRALKEKPISQVDIAMIRKLILERGLSATSLNNLIKNPWDFFYRNILRVPEVQPLHMQFGTVIHNVLEKSTALHTKEKTWPTMSQVKVWLEGQLHQLPIHTEEYTRLHEKGLTVLVVYLEHLKNQVVHDTVEELKVRVQLPLDLPDLPEVMLTGKLDRLDLNADGQAVRVVDYKTGKPKTRGSIEGTNASSDGSYKRQLTFYALLLDLYDDERYCTHSGTLSFVEPNTKGQITEELFMITDEEIEALKVEIKEHLSLVLSGEFLQNRLLAEESEYKDLALALIDNLK